MPESTKAGTEWEFPWPAIPGVADTPRWTGRGFDLGGRRVPLLVYEAGISGWTDDLTDFHEETGGADHPIDLASRRRALAETLKYAKRPHPVVLEVGSSSGFMLRDLRKGLPEALVIGSDYVQGPLERLAASTPDVPLMRMNLVQCPLPDASIDIVVALNVLEHIDDDKAAVGQIYRILKPGGAAVIEVPAGPHLYDVYDEIVMHFRRYTMTGLLSLVSSIGFRVADQSHLGFFVHPAFVAAKRRNQKHIALNAEEQKRLVAANIRTTQASGLLGAVMSVETFLGRWLSYPWGIRCVVTCIKEA